MSLPTIPSLKSERIIVTGASGMLGRAFQKLLPSSGATCLFLSHSELDVTFKHALMTLGGFEPTWILHLAGLVNADLCEQNPDKSFHTHVQGTRHIIELCELTGAALFYPQSFLIYDGATNPADENTPPNPLSVYGQHKWQAESEIKNTDIAQLIVRMGGFFGGESADKNFVGQLIHKWRAGQLQNPLLVGTRVWQPCFTEDLAMNILWLIDDFIESKKKKDVFQLTSIGSATFFETAQRVMVKLDPTIVVEPLAVPYQGDIAKRPECVLLDTQKIKKARLYKMTSWEESLDRYLKGNIA